MSRYFARKLGIKGELSDARLYFFAVPFRLFYPCKRKGQALCCSRLACHKRHEKTRAGSLPCVRASAVQGR